MSSGPVFSLHSSGATGADTGPTLGAQKGAGDARGVNLMALMIGCGVALVLGRASRESCGAVGIVSKLLTSASN